MKAARAEFLAWRRLSLHPVKTHVEATAAPATFLGFELWPGGRRRLPEANVRRFRNRLRGLRDRWRAGTVTRAEVEQRVDAWVAHAAHADTWRLRRAIFRDGWFAPRIAGPGGLTDPCRRMVRGGSWNNNAENQRPGARNRNHTDNRNNNNGFRVAITPHSRSRRGHGRAGRTRERPGPVMMSRRRRCARRRHGRRPSWPARATGAGRTLPVDDAITPERRRKWARFLLRRQESSERGSYRRSGMAD